MRLLGLEVTRALVEKRAGDTARPVHSNNLWNGQWGIVHESYPGAWQNNDELRIESKLAFAAVFGCVRLISSDISKLRIKLVELSNGVWKEVTTVSPFMPVLRKPNEYQNRIQFLEQWVISKLLHGNTYAIKRRDDRNMVTHLYVLDPAMVIPLVTPQGDVYYELRRDDLARQYSERIVVPASEIMHDRYLPLWHPLMGVSPLWAAGNSAKQGSRIQANSEQFFANMSRPSGVLTSPAAISPETAKRLKESFEANFSGPNMGRLLVGGDGLKYEPMTIPASDAQLIEQLKWTAEDVCRAFGVPPHKLGLGQPPTYNNIAQIDQSYYSETLQHPIECIELLFDEGLGLLQAGYGAELDVERGLLRLDPATRADISSKRINAGIASPNEERLLEDREPVQGGEEPFMQQQMFPLKALAERTFPEALPAPAPTAPEAPTAPKPASEDDDEAAAAKLTMALISKFVAETVDG